MSSIVVASLGSDAAVQGLTAQDLRDDAVTWLSLPPAAKRDHLLPVAALFQNTTEDVAELLPYASADLQCVKCNVRLLEDVLVHPGPLQCENGHLLCQNCHYEITRAVVAPGQPKCPKCNTGKFMPIPFLTHLAKNSLFVCPNGCGGLLRGTAFAQHIKEECLMRPIVCPVCAEKVPKKNFLDHIQQKEPRHVWPGPYSPDCERNLRECGSTSWSWMAMLGRASGAVSLEQLSLKYLGRDSVRASITLRYFSDASDSRFKLCLSLTSADQKHFAERTICLGSWQPASTYEMMVTLPEPAVLGKATINILDN